MTLFEDTTANYSGHSSVETQVIQAHVYPSFDKNNMKQSTLPTASETTTDNDIHQRGQEEVSISSPKKCINSSPLHSSPVVTSPLNQVIKKSICTDDANNNSSVTGLRSHTYIRFDESINHLPKDSPHSPGGNSSTMNLEPNVIKCDKGCNGTNCSSSEYPSTSTSTLSSTPNSGGPVENTGNAQPGGDDLMSRILAKFRSLPCAGIILAMLSGIFFATAGFIVKLVPNVNPIEIVVTR